MFVFAIGFNAQVGGIAAKQRVCKQLDNFAYFKFHGKVQEKIE